MNDSSEREQTIRLLVELASSADHSACWGDERAETLLRAQSTAEELRSFGVDEALIRYLWPDT